MTRSGNSNARLSALCAVVMGYFNEDSIEASVRSLIDQESSDPFEVIVVTSGGDSSASIIKERFPDVRVYDSPERLMPGGARSVGVGLANAEIIGFLAADCIALPGWIEGRIQAHRSGNPAVASAIVAPENASPQSVIRSQFNSGG